MLTIVGAGAIGGPIAAAVGERGLDVQVVDSDPAHVEAIRSRGIEIRGVSRCRVRLPAYLPVDFEAGLHTVVLAVKTQAVAPVTEWILPRLEPDGAVLTLLNGLAALDVADAIGADRTLPGSVSFAGHRTAPGRIFYGVPGAIVFGEYRGGASERVARIAAALAPFGDVHPLEDPWGAIWGKLALATVYAACALDGRPTHEVLGDRKSRGVLAGLVAEVRAVAEAVGVRLSPVKGIEVARLADIDATTGGVGDEDWRRLVTAAAAATAAGKTHGGVYQDLVVHRRPTEATHILERLTRVAGDHGVGTPALAALTEAVLQAEQDPGRISPAFLRTVAVRAPS